MTPNQGSGSQRLDVFRQHDRYYGSWRPEKYLFPIDAEELNRLDLFHKYFLVARKDALFVPDLRGNHPLRILDLGTGSGIWAINVAEESAQQPVIMAVDLHKIQPELIPPGITVVQFDIEDSPWDSLLKDCHLVHMRMLFGSIHHVLWPEIYHKAFNHAIPGLGYIEHVEIDWVPGWEGGDIPQPSALEEWSGLFLRALERFGRNARVDSAAVRQSIMSAGFTDFKEEVIRCYLNPWMSDRHERQIARWLNLGLSHGIEAMSLMPMINGLEMTEQQVKDLCQRANNEICVLKHHAYFNLHIWSARRPYD